MKPFKFEPYWKATLWGGESWQLSGVKGDESVTEGGVTLLVPACDNVLDIVGNAAFLTATL